MTYDEDVRLKIVRHALLLGNKSAVDKFSVQLGH